MIEIIVIVLGIVFLYVFIIYNKPNKNDIVENKIIGYYNYKTEKQQEGILQIISKSEYNSDYSVKIHVENMRGTILCDAKHQKNSIVMCGNGITTMFELSKMQGENDMKKYTKSKHDDNESIVDIENIKEIQELNIPELINTFNGEYKMKKTANHFALESHEHKQLQQTFSYNHDAELTSGNGDKIVIQFNEHSILLKPSNGFEKIIGKINSGSTTTGKKE